jgi:hypothetical protein
MTRAERRRLRREAKKVSANVIAFVPKALPKPEPKDYLSSPDNGEETLGRLAVIEDDERQERFHASLIRTPALPVEGATTLPSIPVEAPAVEVLPPRRSWSDHLSALWNALGHKAIGIGIVAISVFVAYTSMRANAWFGHSLTPDPKAGDIYSDLSVAAEMLSCVIPTAIQFYWRTGRRIAAAGGIVLLLVALVVVFFAAGGFALTNIAAGIEARQERTTPEIQTAKAKAEALARSKDAECSTGPLAKRRGPRCLDLEAQERTALTELAALQRTASASGDPQATALGLPSPTLRLWQASAMVALCLCSGLFISFGTGLIWPR